MINIIEEVIIGGVKQHLYTKGKSEDNPILLMIHGGPGATLMPFAHVLEALEDEYTVVHWDQRGAGKSYSEMIPRDSMTLSRFLKDGKEVIGYLQNKYDKEKLYIAGHSWGSIIGINLAYAYPEAISAYIAISQVSNYKKGLQESYRFALAETSKRKMTDTYKQLQVIGEPPYKSLQNLYTVSGVIYSLGGAYHKQVDVDKIMKLSEVYSDDDIKNINKGMQFSAETLIEEILEIDLIKEQKVTFDVPIIFICGRHDYFVPNETTKEFYECLSAPHKEIHYLEESAHFSYVEEPDNLVKLIKNIKIK